MTAGATTKRAPQEVQRVDSQVGSASSIAIPVGSRVPQPRTGCRDFRRVGSGSVVWYTGLA